jgi:hypothetical protein
MTTQLYQADEPITASEVVSKSPCQLHGILLNSVAASTTIQLFDDTTTSSPQNAIGGVWTPGAIVVPTFVPLDIETSKGLTIIIAVSTANITAIGRFAN